MRIKLRVDEFEEIIVQGKKRFLREVRVVRKFVRAISIACILCNGVAFGEPESHKKLDDVLWRIGVRDGDWKEFGHKVGGRVKVPPNWWLTLSWSMAKRLPLLLRARLLSIPCREPIEVQVVLNGHMIYQHCYEPAKIWPLDTLRKIRKRRGVKGWAC